MEGVSKSKMFAELVISMSDGQRSAMANDILSAIEKSEGPKPALFPLQEVKRVADSLLHLATEIEAHYPGGHDW